MSVIEYGTGERVQLQFSVYQRETIPHASSPEPLGFMERLADAEPFPPQSICDIARALRSHHWRITIEQLAKETGKDIRDIRNTANLLAGVIRLEKVPTSNGTEEIISIDMQEIK